jgi:hypothetical protein
MTALQWDSVGERFYETGVDHGVLYQVDESGAYGDGVAWNGLTTVTEKPGGADSNKNYADNIMYVNLIAAEIFEGTIEAFTYPDEFAQNDGSYSPTPGVAIGQQGRRPFGLVYRSLQGNDTEGEDHGYKLHLVYGAQASPSEKAYATVNDSPSAISFSWDFSTTPVPVTGQKPTALITIDSTRTDSTKLQSLEDILFGTASDDPRLPTPDEVLAIFTTGMTSVDLAVSTNQPSYNAGTHVVTLPTVTGVQWKVNGVNKAPGAQPALTAGQTAEVQAVATAGHDLKGDDTWTFEY